jgi:hypothetical protein
MGEEGGGLDGDTSQDAPIPQDGAVVKVARSHGSCDVVRNNDNEQVKKP